jgi:hypothetical protein
MRAPRRNHLHRSLRLEPLEGRSLLSVFTVAGGWTLPGYDLAGTHYDPNASTANIGNQAFSDKFVLNGAYAALTGDVNGDGSLEIVVGDGSNVMIYSGSGELLNTLSGVGRLNILSRRERRWPSGNPGE